jgi:hypothetical protein
MFRCFALIGLSLLFAVSCTQEPTEEASAVDLVARLSSPTSLAIISAENAYESVGTEAVIIANGSFQAQATLYLNREGRYAFQAAGYEEIIHQNLTYFATTDYGSLQEVSLYGHRGSIEIPTAYVGSPDVFAGSPFAYSDYDADIGYEEGSLVELHARGDAASPILYQLSGSSLGGLFLQKPPTPGPLSWASDISAVTDSSGLSTVYVLARPGTAGFQEITVTRNMGLPTEEVSLHYLRITQSTPVPVIMD